MKRVIKSLLLGLALPLVLSAQTAVQNVTYASGQTVSLSGPSTVTAGPAVTVSSGANVTYHANTSITLRPGFTAQAGSYFRAHTSAVIGGGSYSLTVLDGTGNHTGLSAGSMVPITSAAAPAGYQFAGWVLESGPGSFLDANAPATQFTMGAGNATVRAKFIMPDTDGDGMPDTWEDQFPGLNKNVNDAGGDFDGDGVTNLDEYHLWRDPTVATPNFLKPFESDLGAAVTLAVVAKGTGSVTLVAGGVSQVFQFTAAAGNAWNKASRFPPSLDAINHQMSYGKTDTITVTSSGVSDFFIKASVPQEIQRQARPIVEINERLSEGIAKNEIIGGQFTLRMRPDGTLPFGVLDSSNLKVNRVLEFGLGGGRSGRSAGRVLVTLGSWRSYNYGWTVSVAKGETMEGSHEVPTRFQAKVPSGYVDIRRERHQIAVRFYNDATPFVAGTFRDFTSATPVATYVVDMSPLAISGPAPVPEKSLTSGSWNVGVSRRYRVTRSVGTISHVLEHETHWMESPRQGETTAPYGPNGQTIVTYAIFHSAITRIWPWRSPGAERGGLARAEFYTEETTNEISGGPGSTTRNPLHLYLTDYLGATESFGVADREYRMSSDWQDAWMQRAIPQDRGMGVDKHEVARRSGNSTGPLLQDPMVSLNGLGGGVFTEYLSMPEGSYGTHNLDGQPFIALGEPKYTKTSFLDYPLHTADKDLVSTYHYQAELVDGLPQTAQIVTTQNGVEIGKTTYSYSTGTHNSLPTLTTQATQSASGHNATGQDVQTLTNTTRIFSRRIADPDLRGKVLSVTRPDNTKTSYAYQRGTLSGSNWAPNPSGAHLLVAELKGKSGTGVTSYGTAPIDALDLDANRSTVTERILDAGGRLLREATYVYQGSNNFALLEATYHGYDIFGQLVIKADQPITGGAQAGRILYEATYDGLQKQSETDAQGIRTHLFYDNYSRVDTKVRLGASYGNHAIADTTVSYVYDASGRLIGETQSGTGESHLLVSSYSYDTASRPKSQTAPGNIVTTISYDSLTQKTINLPGGGTRVEQVYKDGRRKSVSGSAVPDATTTYEYDSATGFLRTNETLSSGQTTLSVVDRAGRPVRTETATFDGSTRVASKNYNTLGQLVSEDVKVGATKLTHTRLYQYDPNGYGWLYREGLDADNNGSLDPALDFGVTEYESRFQTGAPGHGADLYLYAAEKVWPYAGTNSSTFRYTQQIYTQVSGLTATHAGRTVSLDADLNQTTTTQTLTRASRLLETATVTTGTNQVIRQVNLNGLVVSTTSAQGHTVVQTYDGLGRPQGTVDPRIGASTVTYVANTTQVEKVTAPDGQTTTSAYDAAGRLASQTDHDGKTAWFVYDAAGNLTHTWGHTVNPVKYEYNELGQRTVQRTYRSGTWTGDSLPAGFSGTGDVTTWNYQASTGLMTSKVDGAGTTAYEYDTLARVKKRTDARGWVTNYEYFLNGLPKKTDYADNDTVTTDVAYTYDRAGRLETVTDATGARSFSYYDTWTNGAYDAELRNKSARLKSEQFTSGFYGAGRTLGYDYQYEVANRANGALLSLKIGDGSLYTVSYGYDAVGRLASVSYNAVTPFGYSYVANSDLVDTVAQGSTGYKRDYDYEAASNRVQVMKNQWAALTASTVESRLTYDTLGRRETEKLAGTAWMTALGRGSEPGVHLDYSYSARSEVESSARYQLTAGWGEGAVRPGTDRDYAYDAMGNRTADVIAGVAGTYAPNGLNQYESAPGMPAATYDANGNLKTDGTRSYDYDGENRLIKVTQGANEWNYAYDFLGRRVRKWGTGIPDQKFIYDGWNLVAETDGSGVLTRRYVWGLDVSGTLQGAGGVGGLLLIQDGGSTYSPLYDASHNVIGLYNGSGAIDSAYEYDPFGRPVTANGAYAAANPFRFSTKYTDNETALVYYGYRYYSPLLGRFINRDPIEEEGGVNLYGFCGNDGINLLDFLGLDAFDNLRNTGDPSQGSTSNTVWVGGEPTESTTTVYGTMMDPVTGKIMDMPFSWTTAHRGTSNLFDDVGPDDVRYVGPLIPLDRYSANYENPNWTREDKYRAAAANLAYKVNDGGLLKKLGIRYLPRDGFAAALFYNPSTKQYYLAFRGTEPKDLRDWRADAGQAYSLSTSQYSQAIALARNVRMALGKNVVMVGHSLGGGLASAAAYATGADATTFNAAGLSFKYSQGTPGEVRAHYIRGELLSLGQDFTTLPNAVGQRIVHDIPYITPDIFGVPILPVLESGMRHSMDNFFKL